MIVANGFQILNPDILKEPEQGSDLNVQITYMRRSTILFTPVLPYTENIVISESLEPPLFSNIPLISSNVKT